MPKISELPVNSSPSASAVVAGVDNGETVQIPIHKLLDISIPILEPTSLTYSRQYNGSEYYLELQSIPSTLGIETLVIPSTAMSSSSTQYEPVRKIPSGTITGNTYIKKIYIPDSVTTVGSSAFVGMSDCTIYCQATSKPDGWADGWNSAGCNVVWGAVWQEGEVSSAIPYYDFTDMSSISTIANFYDALVGKGYKGSTDAFANIGNEMYAFCIYTFAGGSLYNVEFLDILSLKLYFYSGSSTDLSSIINGSVGTVTDVFASLDSGSSSGGDVYALSNYYLAIGNDATQAYMSTVKELIEAEGGDATKLNYAFIEGGYEVLIRFAQAGSTFYYVNCVNLQTGKFYYRGVDITTTTVADFFASFASDSSDNSGSSNSIPYTSFQCYSTSYTVKDLITQLTSEGVTTVSGQPIIVNFVGMLSGTFLCRLNNYHTNYYGCEFTDLKHLATYYFEGTDESLSLYSNINSSNLQYSLQKLTERVEALEGAAT